MKNTLLIIICLLSITFCQAQEQTIFGKNGIKLTGLWGGNMNGIIRFDNDNSLSNSGYLMLEFNNDIIIGLSTYNNDLAITSNRSIEIDGSNLLIGHTFDSDRTIHPVFNLSAGFGKIKSIGFIDDRISIIEPSLGLEANIFRFLRLGIEGGYRYVGGISDDGFVDSDDLNSFVVGVRLKFGFSWGGKDVVNENF